MQIEQQIFVVTGAAQGLGRAISLKLAERGAKLALLDVNEAGLAQTEEACQAFGNVCQTYVCNVADEEKVVTTFDSIGHDLGPIATLHTYV